MPKTVGGQMNRVLDLISKLRQQFPRVSGASQDKVADFERRFGVSVPNDLRTFLLAIDGTAGEWDDQYLTWWAVDRIKPVHDELVDYLPDRDLFPACFVFADYMDSSWLFAIQLGGEREQIGRVFLVAVDGTRKPSIAPSFGKFLDLYFSDDRGMYPI